MTVWAAYLTQSEVRQFCANVRRVLLIMTKRLGVGHVTAAGANGVVRDILEQTGYDDIITLV